MASHVRRQRHHVRDRLRLRRWQPDGPLALLAYEAVRTATDPRATLLAFLVSAYDAGSIAAGWDREGFRSSWSPSAQELAKLLGD